MITHEPTTFENMTNNTKSLLSNVDYRFVKLTVTFNGQSKLEFWVNEALSKLFPPKVSLDINYRQASVFTQLVVMECRIISENVRTVVNGLVLTYTLEQKAGISPTNYQD
jgi:hypothetical protein